MPDKTEKFNRKMLNFAVLSNLNNNSYDFIENFLVTIKCINKCNIYIDQKIVVTLSVLIKAAFQMPTVH